MQEHRLDGQAGPLLGAAVRDGHADHVGVETQRRLQILRHQHDVAHAHVAGHKAAWCDRRGKRRRRHALAQTQFQRIAGRVAEADQIGHVAGAAGAFVTFAHSHAGGLQAAQRGIEFAAIQRRQTHRRHVVLAAGTQEQSLFALVHAVATRAIVVAAIANHADDIGQQSLPALQVRDLETQIGEFQSGGHHALPL